MEKVDFLSLSISHLVPEIFKLEKDAIRYRVTSFTAHQQLKNVKYPVILIILTKIIPSVVIQDLRKSDYSKTCPP